MDSDVLTLKELQGILTVTGIIVLILLGLGIAWVVYQNYKYDSAVRKALEKQLKADDKVIAKLLKDKLK